MFQSQYAVGVVLCFLACALIRGVLIYRSKRRSIGDWCTVAGFFGLALRNAEYFIIQQNNVSDDLMYSAFVVSSLFLVGSISLWRKENNVYKESK